MKALVARNFKPGVGLLLDCNTSRNFREPSFKALLHGPRTNQDWTRQPLDHFYCLIKTLQWPMAAASAVCRQGRSTITRPTAATALTEMCLDNMTRILSLGDI